MRSGNGRGRYRLPKLSFLFIVSNVQSKPKRQRHTTHPPQLDEAVVTRRHNQGKSWVDGHPIDTPVVTFEHEFYHRIGVSEHISLIRVGASHLVFEGH